METLAKHTVIHDVKSLDDGGVLENGFRPEPRFPQVSGSRQRHPQVADGPSELAVLYRY